MPSIREIGVIFILTFAFSIFIYVNVDSFSSFGLLINVFGLSLFVLLMAYDKVEVLVLFVVCNFLLGPFVFYEPEVKGLQSFWKISNILAVFLFLKIVVLYKKQFNKELNFLFVCVFLLILGGVNNSELSFSVKLSFIYDYIGSILLAVVLYIKLTRGQLEAEKGTSIWFKLALLVFFLHVGLSYLQMVVPIAVRGDSSANYVNVGSYENVFRPIGFLAASYVYAVSTFGVALLLCFFKPQYKYALLIPIIVPAAISTRSSIVALVLFLTIVVTRKFVSKIPTTMLYVLGITSVVGFLVLLSSQLSFLNLDQSMGTRILLWYTIVQDFYKDFPMQKILFGNGMLMSEQVSNLGGFLDISFNSILSYDNRIDEGRGFPIHNIYLEFLYDYGLLFFLLYFHLFIKGVANFYRGYVSLVFVFLWLQVIVNYAFHNGIFSVWIVLMTLLAAYPPSLGRKIVGEGEQMMWGGIERSKPYD